MGGVDKWLEVFCNNHRNRWNLNPTNAVETFNAPWSQQRGGKGCALTP